MEVYDRVDGSWSGFRLIEGLDATLELSAIQASLPLSEAYWGVFET
jgi:hypothetical protein